MYSACVFFCVSPLIFQNALPGRYLDTDVIVLKPFAPITNVVGYQEVAGEPLLPLPLPARGAAADPKQFLAGADTQVNGAVMKFEARHPFLGACIKEFLTNYKPRPWDFNGPLLLQRVHARLCGREDAPRPAGATPIGPATEACSVTILPRHAFYPMHWRHITRECVQQSIDAPESVALEALLRRESYAVHLYNQRLRSDQVKSRMVQSSTLYVPVVFAPGTLCKRIVNDHCLLCNRPI